jgi:hypothetical protein
VATSDPNLRFSIYKSKVAYSGQVIIPGNGQAPASGHLNSYSVIIVPKSQDFESQGYNKDLCMTGDCDCCGVSRRYGNGPACDCFAPELRGSSNGTATMVVTLPFSNGATRMRYQSLFMIAGLGDMDGDGIRDQVGVVRSQSARKFMCCRVVLICRSIWMVMTYEISCVVSCVHIMCVFVYYADIHVQQRHTRMRCVQIVVHLAARRTGEGPLYERLYCTRLSCVDNT